MVIGMTNPQNAFMCTKCAEKYDATMILELQKIIAEAKDRAATPVKAPEVVESGIAEPIDELELAMDRMEVEGDIRDAKRAGKF